MITVQDAANLVRLHAQSDWGDELLPLDLAYGRVLAESICADRDLPPFDQVRMDGIAIRFADWQKGIREFNIVGIQRAGQPPLTLSGEGCTIEVMTGCVLPAGADCVIPVEKTEQLSRDLICIAKGYNVEQRQHIQFSATDHHRGDLLVNAGNIISPPVAGIAASCGKSAVLVKRLPTVAIISTGDELIDIQNFPLPHQIRQSNAFALQGFFSGFGIAAKCVHLPDDLARLLSAISELLEQSDIIVLTGGVSMGKFDHVPDVLEQLDVTCHFHRVAQKPGKPIWFGTKGSTTVFALPGNPVSALACAARYIAPVLRKSRGLSELVRIRFEKTVTPHPRLTLLAPVRLVSAAASEILAWKGSGDFSALAHADGFAEIPAALPEEEFSFYPFGPGIGLR